jgi:hypothetical protein
MRRPVTIRVPDAWNGLDSDCMTRWLEDFFACPYSLPNDPGAGQARVCLSLPATRVQQLQRKLHCPAANALRRLAAAHSRELMPSSSSDASQMACSPVNKHMEPFSQPEKRKNQEAGFSVPSRHPGGLFYREELAVSPVEQHRRQHLMKKGAL